MDLNDLEQILQYNFKDSVLVLQALTHPSYRHEQAAEQDYQRLEFLGDAVLGMLLAELLYMYYPDSSEGDLSRFRAQLAGQDNLATVARDAGLGSFIRLGRGEEQSIGRDKDSILSDVLEAIIGAVFLDGGLAAARLLVRRIFVPALDSAGTSIKPIDAKSELQELASASKLPPPRYLLLAEEGPPHERRYRFQVLIADEVVGEGEGRSKKAAQQSAASQALNHFCQSCTND